MTLKSPPAIPKIWTKEGLSRLGQIIRLARAKKGISLDDAARLIVETTNIKVSKKTIGNIENGIGMPHYNTLATIAAAGFVVNGQGNPLSVEDFVQIASEGFCKHDRENMFTEIMQLEEANLSNNLPSSGGSEQMKELQRLIEEYICDQKIDEEEFAKRALLHPVVIRSIFQGVLLGEPEVTLSLLGSILKNPSTQRTFTSWVELAEYCSFEIKNKNSAPETEQNGANK